MAQICTVINGVQKVRHFYQNLHCCSGVVCVVVSKCVQVSLCGLFNNFGTIECVCVYVCVCIFNSQFTIDIHTLN